MRKGEIACYKQFLLFSQCFPQLYIFSVSKCGIVWLWVNNWSDTFNPLPHNPDFWKHSGKGENVGYQQFFLPFPTIFTPAQVAQWWACRTHDLVVVSLIPSWGKLSFGAYFRLSLLKKHVRKVVGCFEKKSCVSTGVRKRGNTCASPTAMIWP